MTEGKNEQKEAGSKVKIFTVPFALGEIKENLSIATNTSSKLSKEQIIKQAFDCHSQGNILEAAKHYQYFIDRGFSDHRVFTNYGVIYIALGKLKEAQIFLRKAIAIKPDFEVANLNLGNLLRDQGKV